MFQQYAVPEDNEEFEGRVRPYVDQVRMVDVLSFYLICLVSELNFTVYISWNMNKQNNLAFD